MLNHLGPGEASLLKLAIGCACIVVAAAIGWMMVQQTSGRRHNKVIGWAVGLACFFLLMVLAEPVRTHLNYNECHSQRLHGDEFQSCMDGDDNDRQDEDR